jgi:hypothetical protein
MSRIWLLTLALAAGPVAAGEARKTTGEQFPQGTRVIVVGPITRVANGGGVAVRIGPDRRDFALHLKNARLLGHEGNRIKSKALKDNTWVRAEGQVMDNPRRIRVDRLQVVGSDLPGLQRSAFYRTGLDQGYIVAVAGTRAFYPEAAGGRFPASPFTLVGRLVEDAGEGARSLRVESAGNRWTLSVNRDAQVLDSRGEKIAARPLTRGQWIRATGWQIDDLRMRVVRIEEVGGDEPYRRSAFFRAEFPLGYVDRISGLRTDGKPVTVSGTVTYVDPEGGYFTVKDSAGKEHGIYAELAEILRDSQAVLFNTLRTGEVVTVNVRHIQF